MRQCGRVCAVVCERARSLPPVRMRRARSPAHTQALPADRTPPPPRSHLPLLTLQLQVSETMSETLGASAGSLGASAGTGMARPDTRANRPQSIDVNA